MSSAEAFTTAAVDDQADIEYRSLSAAAIASVVFGLLSLLVVVAGRSSFESALAASPLPLIGAALGIVALRSINAAPDARSGRAAAIAGIALSMVFLAAGLAYAGYVHATEVPDGYIRTSFAEFKPDEHDIRGNRPVPPEVAALDGKKVFIKGYFRPDSSRFTSNVREFLLVRDNNQCCFGDMNTVQFFDQVAVATVDGVTVDYSPGLFRMGGRLHIKPQNLGSDLPVYILEADYAG
jgi:hypothetical protein